MDDFAQVDSERLLSGESRKFKRNKNDTWYTRLWNAFTNNLGMSFFLFFLFIGAALGMTAFGQVNSKWSDIESIHQQCKPQKVNRYMLEERIFDTKRGDWPSWSKSIQGSRYNPHVRVTSKSIKHWQKICGAGTEAFIALNTQAGISSTVTSDFGLNMLFVPTWGFFNQTGGRLYAINAADCTIAWNILVSDLSTGTVPGNDGSGVINPYAAVRTSLDVIQNRTGGTNLIFGDLGTGAYLNRTMCINSTTCGARVYSLEASTGKLLWRTLITEPSPITGYFRQSDIITSSPTVVGSEAIFGMSSTQSGDVATTGFLDFYGRYWSIDINDGTINWIHRTNSDAQIVAGNYGASIWDSSPPYDYNTQQVFLGTSNLYNYSTTVLACLQAGHTRQYCMLPGIINDSVFGVRLNNDGQRSWIYSPVGVDAWNTACIGQGNPANCPAQAGPDYDFGTGGIIIENECGQRYLIVFEKSGILYSLDVDTRDVKWKTYIGPGSSLIPSWGISFDGEKIYLSMGNSLKRSYIALDGTLRCDGFWAAVNAWSGKIEWMTQTPCSRASADCPSQVPFYDTNLVGIVPESQLTYADRPTQRAGSAAPCYGTIAEDYRNDPLVGAAAVGGVITTQNFMFGASYTGYMHAFDKSSGKILDLGLPRCATGIIYGSASISLMQNNSQILTWGCGYGRVNFGFPTSYGDDELMMIRLPMN